ncbi:MAG TPA: hypothetical protein VHK67_03015 [Rhabdochlamydiaceae bacterium]|nr:hypothetical protein [Rhabdochlamydiaceae bacterium]
MMKKIAICFTLLLAQAWTLSCTTPVTISEPGRGVSDPSVAINEEGEVLALWVSENPDEKTETAMAATKDPEKKWSAVALSESARGIDYLNSMTDPQGNHFVSWKLKNKDLEGNKLKYRQFAKKEKSKDWSRAVNVVSPEDQMKWPQMVFDSQGNALFFSNVGEGQSNGISIFYSHQKNEIDKRGGFSLPQEYLVKNQSGKTFAWWSGTSFKDHQLVKTLKGVWLEENGRWSDPTTFFSFKNDPYFSREKEVMNSRGDMAMIWSTSSRIGSDRTLQAITCFNGEWSEPFDLAIDKGYFYGVKLAMNDNGHIVASWPGSERSKKVTYVVDKPAGQPWSSPIALVDLDEESESRKISIDEQGNILVAWTMKEGRKEVPYAAYKPVNQEWAAPARLSNGAQAIDDLKAQSNHQGSFVVLWSEVKKKQISIHGASLSTATKEWSSATISPEGQDCGDFKFAFNKKGQGIIVWKTTWDTEDFYVQIAELKVD